MGVGGRKRSFCLHKSLGWRRPQCPLDSRMGGPQTLCETQQTEWSPSVPGIEPLFSGFQACNKLSTFKQLPRPLTVQSLGVSKPTARFNTRNNTFNPQNMFLCSKMCVTNNGYYFRIPYSSNGLCPLWGTKWFYIYIMQINFSLQKVHVVM